MGWEPLLGSLEAWFADAWSRGLYATASDLGWLVATLRHPSLTVSPGLRELLESTGESRELCDDVPELPDAVLAAVAAELRRAVERHGRLEEPRAAYRSDGRAAARVRDAAASSPVRSP